VAPAATALAVSPASPGDDFLGVARSVTGRRWRLRPGDDALARRIAQGHGLSETLARALAARGVVAETAENFLRPTLKALFPDPSSFLGMDEAASVIVEAIETDRPTVVFADYDVDGASSAALIVRWSRAMGRELPIYVPDRLAEGYGPSPAAFRRMREAGVELVITVDCGAAAEDALVVATKIGLDVVVIDHHLMRAEPPPARALVNPNRPGCNSGQGKLAAAGVTFVLLAALNREARRRGLFAEQPEPDLRRWLDLAALGAVCDVTELTGFNRALAAQGLKVMSGWGNPGLKALLEVAGLAEGAAGVFHAGFVLGPRINAGGRIGRSDLGARLLSTDDPGEAQALAEELDVLNAQRKTAEARILDEAAAQIETEGDPSAPVLVAARDGWHPGIIGVVAGRLRERYRRPVVVIGLDPEGAIGRGSGRSQPGVNLGAAVQAAFDAGLLLSGGGHPMAAGLAIRPASIPAFRAFLCEALADQSAQAVAEDALEIDALLTPRSAGRQLFEAFQALQPHGPGNPEPTFALAGVRVDQPLPLRGGHFRCRLVDPTGRDVKAVAWRSDGSEIGRRLAFGGAMHVAGRLKADDWNGRAGVELEIEDVADVPRVA
jgi:single-stranded-DNA-specific exonuclease